jgi:hypothetical protein
MNADTRERWLSAVFEVSNNAWRGLVRPNTVHFELWGSLQSAEGFSPTPSSREYLR